VLTALAGADLILHGTEWAEYRELNPATVATVVRERHLIDGRNILDPDTWRNAGFTYRALGRPNA
ncbi:MAG: UDP binding domain-containing protein, partial [Actinomycetota bacterium]|nr:UDP binding domain-containing protein [Actinomycetota bacterium]